MQFTGTELEWKQSRGSKKNKTGYQDPVFFWSDRDKSRTTWTSMSVQLRVQLKIAP